MTGPDALEVCRRAVAAFNANDPAAFEELFTPDIKRHDLQGVIDDWQGRENVAGFLSLLRTAMPDLHIEVEDAFGAGDRVAMHLTFSGTHLGELLGAAPTGKRIAFKGVNLYRLEGGRIAETWQMTDWAGALRQIGAGLQNAVRSDQDTYSVRPIGFVRSSLKRPEDAPMQGFEGAPDAWLEINPGLLVALKGVGVGEEVILLTWFHQARRDVLQVHPRSDESRPLTGVFETRSPERPNPIGLHRVHVLEIDGARLRVGPLEAIDGTPLIDIKPVLAQSDDA